MTTLDARRRRVRQSAYALTRITQEIFLKLYNNGYMEERNMTQLYCEKDDRFLADRYVSGTCPKCGYDVSAR